MIAIICLSLLSVLGYLGKNNIYRNYKPDVRTTPYFALVFDGIHDGVYPWEIFGAEHTAPDIADTAEKDDGSEAVQQGNQIAQSKRQDTLEKNNTKNAGDISSKAFVNVDEGYFDDAVFIGDSRTVGLHDYGGLDSADFFATVGMNVYDLWTEEFCEVDGEKLTLEEALKKRSYGKVYFQIGINEMGRGTLDGFMERYTASVQKFMELQPDAIIYVQGIMRVAREKSETDEIFNNQGISQRNERISQLADNIHIFYIDMNEVVCDDEGNLKDDLTFDNLHLYGSKYNIWVDFLKTKGIEEDKL